MVMDEQTPETSTYMGYWRIRFIANYTVDGDETHHQHVLEYPTCPSIDKVVDDFQSKYPGVISWIEQEVVVKVGTVFPINK